MNKRLGFAVIALCFAVPRLVHAGGDPAPIAASENAFALALYQDLDAAPGNFIFSPYSINAAMSMVLAGAKGQTAREIAHGLRVDGLHPLAGQTFESTFLEAVRAEPSVAADAVGSTFDSANELWGQTGYAFHPDYLKTISTVFGGGLTPVDFTDADAAAGQINAWVAAQTDGEIQNLIAPTALSPATRLVLTNAVYFKGEWTQTFDLSATLPAPFHVAPGQDVMPEMMNQVADFAYGAGDGVKILSMDYRGDPSDGEGYVNPHISMVIVLPDDDFGLARFEAGMTAGTLQMLLGSLRSTRVQLSLPKFTGESSFDLSAALQDLGMKQVFDRDHADLSGIAAASSGQRLFVGGVVHKAYVMVDEEGTVAAAATGVVMAQAAGIEAPPPPPVPFIVDHPFLYLIRDDVSGQILFIGRVVDPGN